MNITQVRQILRSYGLGARKIEGSQYDIRGNGEAWFSLDIEKLQDEAHAKQRIQQELDYRRDVATRRWQ